MKGKGLEPTQGHNYWIPLSNCLLNFNLKKDQWMWVKLILILIQVQFDLHIDLVGKFITKVWRRVFKKTIQRLTQLFLLFYLFFSFNPRDFSISFIMRSGNFQGLILLIDFFVISLLFCCEIIKLKIMHNSLHLFFYSNWLSHVCRVFEGYWRNFRLEIWQF